MSNKVVVTFYSRTGHTRALGLEIARRLRSEGLVAECRELEPAKEMSLLHAGAVTLTHGSEPIKDCDVDLDCTNLLVLGTPVWMGTLAPYLRSFLEGATDLKGIPVLLFATCGKRDGSCEEEMRELVRERGGRPFDYHVWRIQRDGAEGLERTASYIATSALDLLPGVGGQR